MSMVVYTFATLAFYLLGAAVLGRIGLNPEGRDMVRTLSAMYIPVFGRWATSFSSPGLSRCYTPRFVAAAGNAMVADASGLWSDGWLRAGQVKWTRGSAPSGRSSHCCCMRSWPSAMIVTVASPIHHATAGRAALNIRYRRSDRSAAGPAVGCLLWMLRRLPGRGRLVRHHGLCQISRRYDNDDQIAIIRLPHHCLIWQVAATAAGKVSVEGKPFGQTSDGQAVTIFEFTNANGLRARVMEYGAILVSLEVPNREGRPVDIAAG
jgi:hypothetical protein